MPTKTGTEIPADKLELYDRLVGTNPDMDRKGASMPYTSLNGHMFSFFIKEGTLALRLAAEDRETYKAKLCQQHGRVMQEYVQVPDALLEKTQELKTYFDLSVAYVRGLKPKATTRKKATGKKPKQ